MDKKFVVFLDNEGLQSCICSAAEKAGAIVFKSFHSQLVKKIFAIHNAWKLNKYMELPFKSLWFRRCFNEELFDADEKIYFLFYESFYLAYSKKYLRHLRKKFPKAKFCYIFLNPIDERKSVKYNSIKKYYDAGVAIYREDVKKYGLLLNEYYCYSPPEIDENTEYGSDVFFVGVNKGRLERMISVYELLSKSGLKCDFHMTEVEEGEQKYKDYIVYNKKMSYTEYLQRLNNSKCLLEILQDDASYFSIRTIEAMQFHKKLLTTNETIKYYDFYDERIIRVFKNVSDIDVNFIRQLVTKDLFPNDYLWSFEAFEEYLVSNIR